MIFNTDSIILDLPLSWVRSKTHSIQKKSFQFKTNKMNWISLADIPESGYFTEIIGQLQKTFPKGILLRGCTTSIARELRKKKFEVLPIGQEAIIDLKQSVFAKKSLNALVKRGKKQNSVRKIEHNIETQKKLDLLKKQSAHGQKVQLKHLFIDVINKNTECFICENNNEWNGAITISRVNKHKAHTELLIRRQNAPAGTMEMLIEHVFYYLSKRGYLWFSLGEVPFMLKNIKNLPLKSLYMCKLGQAMRFAYNSSSLYKFKNKFSPKWETVYLSGYPKISLLSLLEMGIRSNYVKLILMQFYILLKEKLIKKIFTGCRVN